MHLEIFGVWIDGPVPSDMAAAGAPPVAAIARQPQPVEWPRGEDGSILLRLYDHLGQRKVLDLAKMPTPDSIKLAIGFDLNSGAMREFLGVAGTDPGSYVFQFTAAATSDMIGPMVYAVRATVAGSPSAVQQVSPPAYFTVGPSVSS